MVTLQKPAKGDVTKGFSVSHKALDFGWGNGPEVYAAAAGVLSYKKVFGYGLRATIVHADGTKTTYSHLKNILKSGNVGKGYHIANMGNSGSFAVGVHLHFEYWVNGKKVYPSFSNTAGNPGTPIDIIKENDMAKIAIINTGKGYEARLVNFETGTYTDVLGDATLASLRNGKFKNAGPLGDEYDWTALEWNRIKTYVLSPILAAQPVGTGNTPIDYALIAKTTNDEFAKRVIS